MRRYLGLSYLIETQKSIVFGHKGLSKQRRPGMSRVRSGTKDPLVLGFLETIGIAVPKYYWKLIERNRSDAFDSLPIIGIHFRPVFT